MTRKRLVTLDQKAAVQFKILKYLLTPSADPESRTIFKGLPTQTECGEPLRALTWRKRMVVKRQRLELVQSLPPGKVFYRGRRTAKTFREKT